MAVLFALLASPALAAGGLRMENALPLAPVRQGGPLYLTGELQWDRPDLLEGRLRFVLRNGPETLSAVETDPIVIVAGGTRFRQLLPVPDGVLGYGMSGVEVTFVADGAEFELGEIPVTLPQLGSWQSVVLCAEPTSGTGLGDAEQLRDEVAFEKAMTVPESNLSDGDEFAAKTARIVLPASDFPEQPLAYCAFDTLLLPGDGFTRLSGRQLDAIAAWVRAGGAVCVAPDGRPLEKKQVEFLDDLFRDTDTGPFVRDDEGRLLEPEGTRDGVFARRAGLGFAGVLLGATDEFRFDTPAWREAHARLWRLREEYVGHRRAGRPITAAMFTPNVPAQPTDPNGMPNYGYASYRQDVSLWTFPTPSFGTSVIEALRPSSIRLMPGWAVLLILFGYASLVGPIDYLLLGRLRKRKWTWLTFPAVTLAVTWGVVATADAFMSDNDHVRSVEIVDLDSEGDPVRRTRLELLFHGSSRPVLHELKRAYFSRLDQAHFQSADQYGQWVMVGGVSRYMPQTSTDNDAPTGPYVGTLPSRYAVPQQVAKWTPQVNRTFEIAPETEVPAIDWASVEKDASSPILLPDGRTGHAVRIGSTGTHGPSSPLGSVREGSGFGTPYPYSVQQGQDGAVPFLEATTAAEAEQRSSLQFQRSPLGLGRLDDLPFIDVTAEGLDALAVWVQQADGGIVVYRKPVSKEGSGLSGSSP